MILFEPVLLNHFYKFRFKNILYRFLYLKEIWATIFSNFSNFLSFYVFMMLTCCMQISIVTLENRAWKIINEVMEKRKKNISSGRVTWNDPYKVIFSHETSFCVYRAKRTRYVTCDLHLLVIFASAFIRIICSVCAKFRESVIHMLTFELI